MIKQLTARFGRPMTLVVLLLLWFWLIVLVLLPQLIMIDYSFKPNLIPSQLGGPEDVYTLGNYQTLIGNDIHRTIFFKTIWSSILVTVLTLLVSYPVAYFLAQLATAKQVMLIALLLVIPYWINEILRTFSWYLILSFQGPLNALLLGLGLIDRPVRFLTGDGGVLIGMVYANQVRAARNLGAGLLRIHWRIVIPHAKPGIATGCIMVFMLAAGSYAVPALLGSPGSRWFTQIIYNWFFEGGDWNMGAAYAFVLLILCIGFIAAVMKVFRIGLGDIGK